MKNYDDDDDDDDAHDISDCDEFIKVAFLIAAFLS